MTGRRDTVNRRPQAGSGGSGPYDAGLSEHGANAFEASGWEGFGRAVPGPVVAEAAQQTPFTALTRRDLAVSAGRAAAAFALVMAQPWRLSGFLDEAIAATPTAGFADADYWAFIDPIVEHMNRLWDERDNCYVISGAGETVINAALCTIHAVAAMSDHEGPSRNDARAVRLARRLCASAPWSDRQTPVEADKMFHKRGWTESMHHRSRGFDKSIDPKVAEALEAVWRARRILHVPQPLVNLMVARVNACAHDAFFRFPGIRLNQLNWNAELYSYAARMTGSPTLLKSDYRRQVVRFCSGAKRPWTAKVMKTIDGGSGNLGPGYRFHYLPNQRAGHPFNVDSAEYANMTIHFLLFHRQARVAGMAPLDRNHHALLEAWVERVLMGYWTHAGFLNWDSGLGLTRWQIGKTFAFAQQGLIAIANSPQFHSRPEFAPWAKYLLDQGFVLYQRWAREDGDGLFAPPFLNDAHAERGGGQAGKWLFAVRMAVNAARAIDLGMGTAKAVVPKPIYAFDPDIGRLAVSTPTYSAALLADNRGAVPYGGIEVARLYDADGRPVATIGGTPPGGFGIVVRASNNRLLLTSQKTVGKGSITKPPIRLTDAPRGRGRLASYPRHAYAAAFNRLAAVGVVRKGGLAIRTEHVFRSSFIETKWTVTSATVRRLKIDALLPSRWRAAKIEAVLHDGRHLPLVVNFHPAKGRVALKDVAWFYVQSLKSGYVVVVRKAPAGAYASALPTHPSGFEPHPGPTLALRLSNASRVRSRTLTMAIAPARNAAEAAAVASALIANK